MKKSPQKRPQKKTATSNTKRVVSSELALPGYWAFSKEVIMHLDRYRGVFGRLLALGVTVVALVAGLSMVGVYAGLSQATEEVSGQLSGGALKTAVEVVALFLSVITGSLNGSDSELQQLYVGFVFLMLWLVVVWLLRQQMASSQVTLRDGLYNAAAPLISTLLVVAFGVLQLLPFGLMVAFVATLSTAGILTGVFAVLGVLLSLGILAATLYWLVGTLFALNVVTIPGTYPWAALGSAKQLIAGYRLLVVKRVLWLCFILLIASLVLIPVIVFDAMLGYALALPVVAVVIMGTVALFMYGAAYLYLLYRKVIDGRAD